jgi:hypothetical protein
MRRGEEHQKRLFYGGLVFAVLAANGWAVHRWLTQGERLFPSRPGMAEIVLTGFCLLIGEALLVLLTVCAYSSVALVAFGLYRGFRRLFRPGRCTQQPDEWVLIVLAIIMVAAFAWRAWPTPYREAWQVLSFRRCALAGCEPERYRGLDGGWVEADATEAGYRVRTNRVTGTRWAYTRLGWRRVSSEPLPPPPDLEEEEARAEIGAAREEALRDARF